MKVFNSVILLIALFLSSCTSQNDKISQWRGSDRDGIYNETNLLKEWPESGPELLWSVEDLYKGYSSVTVANETVYFTGINDSVDMLIAIGIDGKLKWQTAYGRAWDQSFPDSRSTPTIEDNRIYVTSGYGELVCLNTENGEIIWSQDVSKQYEGPFGDWGISESPLLVDNKICICPGGEKTTMVALDKMTGELIWATESIKETPAYASPLLIEENGEKIILQVMSNNIFGVNAETGKIKFKYDYAQIQNKASIEEWDGAPFTNTNTPIYHNKNIYVTSGYNHVGVMFELNDELTNIEIKWIDTTLDVHHGGAVLVDGYIYGANWLNNRAGNWCCIDWETGKTIYEHKWSTKGSIIYNDGMLYCYNEKPGSIALVEAAPEKFNLISSFEVPKGTGPHWSHLVIKDGIMYVRHQDALMAYKLT